MNSTPLFATTTDNCVSVAERSYRVAKRSYRVLDTQIIANQELNKYLESQADEIAPEILPIVPKIILVEKIGITRNSSSTPYLVYSIEDRRHCIFFKRKLLWHLLQTFLKAQHKIEDKIRAVISTDRFDLKVMLGKTWQTLFKPHVTKFVERWNNRYQVAASPEPKTLKGYRMGVRGGKAWAKNYQVIQKHRQQLLQQKQEESGIIHPSSNFRDNQPNKPEPLFEETSNHQHTQEECKIISPTNSPENLTSDGQTEISSKEESGYQQPRQLDTATPQEKLASAMKSAIAYQNWGILTEALYGNEQYKVVAWQQLSIQEQEQLKELTPPQVKMLVQARKAGKIAAFIEHEVGDIFFVWLHGQLEAETLTSSGVPSFLQNLA